MDSFIQENIRANIQDVCSSLNQAAEQWERPAVLWKPRLYPDGDQWCALYGANVQEGLAGFGDTPALALRDFDNNFYKQKLPAQEALARVQGGR